jgi:hypothetical protein
MPKPDLDTRFSSLAGARNGLIVNSGQLIANLFSTWRQPENAISTLYLKEFP